jgi:hypothetical protein
MSNRGPEEMSQIHTLRQTYSDLYDITETINGIYGYQITLELAYDFVSFVLFLYHALDVLSDVKKMGERTLREAEKIILEVASSLCW